MNAYVDALVRWLGEQLDADERIARAASGSTVDGEPGNWKPAPGGDEWEASRTDCDEDELLVALRPGLPRPPDVMSGRWGAVVSLPEFDDPCESVLPQLQHAARHDPARVLREIDAKRQMLRALESAEASLRNTVPGREPHELMTGSTNSLRAIVRMLATVYADRPGYRAEWRP